MILFRWTSRDKLEPQYPETDRLPWVDRTRPRAYSPCLHRTLFYTSMRTRVDPGLNNATSFAVERYFIRPAKCEACVQHDKRDEQRSILNRHRRKTNSTPEPCLIASNLSVRSPILHQPMVISRISSFSELKYSSNHLYLQVTENHRSLLV
jgi:hypothetical protein